MSTQHPTNMVTWLSHDITLITTICDMCLRYKTLYSVVCHVMWLSCDMTSYIHTFILHTLTQYTELGLTDGIFKGCLNIGCHGHSHNLNSCMLAQQQQHCHVTCATHVSCMHVTFNCPALQGLTLVLEFVFFDKLLRISSVYKVTWLSHDLTNKGAGSCASRIKWLTSLAKMAAAAPSEVGLHCSFYTTQLWILSWGVRYWLPQLTSNIYPLISVYHEMTTSINSLTWSQIMGGFQSIRICSIQCAHNLMFRSRCCYVWRFTALHTLCFMVCTHCEWWEYLLWPQYLLQGVLVLELCVWVVHRVPVVLLGHLSKLLRSGAIPGDTGGITGLEVV